MLDCWYQKIVDTNKAYQAAKSGVAPAQKVAAMKKKKTVKAKKTKKAVKKVKAQQALLQHPYGICSPILWN